MNPRTVIVLAVMLCAGGCRMAAGPAVKNDSLTFSVVDVGQGLAQIGVTGGRAILWDIGDSAGYTRWKQEYADLDKPEIVSMVISHAHRDHYGALRRWDTTIRFSGNVVCGSRTDTAALRSAAGNGGNDLSFRIVNAGDTLGGLDGVLVTCLWPPAGDVPVPAGVIDTLNYFSLCFRVRYGSASLLITSDIDSVAERRLCSTFGHELRSDIMIAPHHGSAGSVSAVFFGFVHPGSVVISCARTNRYGHPSSRLLDLLHQSGIQVFATYDQGSLCAIANGAYWEWRSCSR